MLEHKSELTYNNDQILDNLYYYTYFLEKNKFPVDFETQNYIKNYIYKTYKIDGTLNLQTSDKYRNLDILSKIAFISNSINSKYEKKMDSILILDALEKVKQQRINIEHDDMITLFYEIIIRENIRDIDGLKRLKDDAIKYANTILDHLGSEDIYNFETAVFLNLSLQATHLTKDDVKTRELTENITQYIDSQIDMPGAMRYIYYDCLLRLSIKKEKLLGRLLNYPRSSESYATAPARLIPSFRTLYGFVNVYEKLGREPESIRINIHNYTNEIWQQYKNFDRDFEQCYYLIKLKPFIDNDKRYNDSFNKAVRNAEKYIQNNSLSEKNFSNYYWCVEILSNVNKISKINAHKIEIEKTMTEIEKKYSKDHDFLLIKLMYVNIHSRIFPQYYDKTVLLNLINDITNYRGDFYLDILHNYFEVCKTLNFNIPSEKLIILNKKLDEYRTSSGYFSNSEYKSTSIIATSKGIELKTQIKKLQQ